MSYLVLARKYRPQTFKDIIGQEHIVKTLQNSLSNKRIGHAYLFSGPRGVGKTTTARIFAKALNCKSGHLSEPCNKCPNCEQITSGFSLDVIEIDGASNRGIDEIRALRENVKFVPSSSRYKIYIIDEVHMLTIEAFNALLKTLEEPPAHIVFIFATTQPHKVPSTILSRCQRFNFRQISLDEIVDRLTDVIKLEKIESDKDTLCLIAKNASGSLRDALTILDEVMSLNPNKIVYNDVSDILGIIDYKILIDFGEIITTKDIQKGLIKIDELFNSGYDLSQFVKDLREHFRNLLIVNATEDFSSLVNLSDDNLEDVKSQSQKFTQSDLIRIIDILTTVEERIKYSDQKRLILEIGMAKLCSSFIPLDKILKKIQILEERLNTQNSDNPNSDNDLNNSNDEVNFIKSQSEDKESPSVNNIKEGAAKNYSGNVPDTLIELMTQWESILKSIDEKKGSLTVFLKASKPIGINNGILTLAFNKKDTFLKESVDREENKTLLSKIIEETIYKKYRIKCILTDEVHVSLAFEKEKEYKNISQEKKNLGKEERTSTEPVEKETLASPKNKGAFYTPKEIVNREPIIQKALDIFEGEISEIE